MAVCDWYSECGDGNDSGVWSLFFVWSLLFRLFTIDYKEVHVHTYYEEAKDLQEVKMNWDLSGLHRLGVYNTVYLSCTTILAHVEGRHNKCSRWDLLHITL